MTDKIREMAKQIRLDRLPRTTDHEELGKAESWKDVEAILKRRVDRGDFIVRGMTDEEFDKLTKEEQMEVLIENRIELLTPEARRRLVP